MTSSDVFRPSFPPRYKIEDFIHIDDLRNNSRGPNAFFVYRKIYTKHLLQLNCRFPMTQVSKLASDHWNSEPSRVKKYYRKIAKDIDQELDKRRQRIPRNSLSFSNILTPSNYNPKPKVQQQPSPITEWPLSYRETFNKVIVNDPTLAPAAPAPIDLIESTYFSYNSESESDSSNDIPPSNVLSEFDFDWSEDCFDVNLCKFM
uniref:MATA-HMG n=1 Tax=Rhizophagus irregularis TaxID=588596 RepID=A0A1B1EU59_9GLOM|nr:MATA-HMG [Rhizophagus irregularis]